MYLCLALSGLLVRLGGVGGSGMHAPPEGGSDLRGMRGCLATLKDVALYR